MDGCPFCRLARGPSSRDMGHEVRSFEPLNPVVPGHRLFIPVQHVTEAAADPELAGRVFAAAAQWGSEDDAAFNLITSAGVDATQTVFHLHVHYVPRREGDGLHLPWTGQAHG